MSASWTFLKSDRGTFDRWLEKKALHGKPLTEELILEWFLARDTIPKDEERVAAVKEVVGAVLEIVQRPEGLYVYDELFSLVIPEIHKLVRRMINTRRAQAEAARLEAEKLMELAS